MMALPAIADVHRASPAAEITIGARPAIAPLFTMVNGVGSLVDDSLESRRIIEKTPDPFDTALLLPNSFRSALIVWRAGIPERWGYRTDARGPLLTRAIPRAPEGVHQVEYYQQLVHELGFPNGAREPRLEMTPERQAAGAEALARAGWDRNTPLVALAPGAAYGGAKRWPAESFAELARGLAAGGVTTVMVGSAADAETAAEVMRALDEGGSGSVQREARRVLSLVGNTDLPTLAGVFANCRGLVTNDSGAMHLAAALGVRVTAIFGPTDERVTGLRGRGPDRSVGAASRVRLQVDHAILSIPVWCRPCLLRECPLDHSCMRGIGVEAVLAEARRSL